MILAQFLKPIFFPSMLILYPLNLICSFRPSTKMPFQQDNKPPGEPPLTPILRAFFFGSAASYASQRGTVLVEWCERQRAGTGAVVFNLPKAAPTHHKIIFVTIS